MSMAGGGMTTASSAARDGATANAAIASAAAAQSERVRRVRRMGFPFSMAADGHSLGWSNAVRKVDCFASSEIRRNACLVTARLTRVRDQKLRNSTHLAGAERGAGAPAKCVEL